MRMVENEMLSGWESDEGIKNTHTFFSQAEAKGGGTIRRKNKKSATITFIAQKQTVK